MIEALKHIHLSLLTFPVMFINLYHGIDSINAVTRTLKKD